MPEGSREFDRSPTFREKFEWLEEAGTPSLQFQAQRRKMKTRRVAK